MPALSREECVRLAPNLTLNLLHTHPFNHVTCLRFFLVDRRVITTSESRVKKKGELQTLARKYLKKHDTGTRDSSPSRSQQLHPPASNNTNEESLDSDVFAEAFVTPSPAPVEEPIIPPANCRPESTSRVCDIFDIATATMQWLDAKKVDIRKQKAGETVLDGRSCDTLYSTLRDRLKFDIPEKLLVIFSASSHHQLNDNDNQWYVSDGILLFRNDSVTLDVFLEAFYCAFCHPLPNRDTIRNNWHGLLFFAERVCRGEK